MKNVHVLMTIVCLFTGYSVFGQECLKEPDPFTNEAVRSFEWKSGGIRTLHYESRGGKNTLEVRFGEVGAVEYTIPKGSEVLVKLENGDIIKLNTMHETQSVAASTTIDADNNVTFSMYFLKMEVSNEQLKQLAKFKVTNMRVPDLHGSFLTYGTKELRNRFERFLFEGAKCLTDGM